MTSGFEDSRVQVKTNIGHRISNIEKRSAMYEVRLFAIHCSPFTIHFVRLSVFVRRINLFNFGLSGLEKE